MCFQICVLHLWDVEPLCRAIQQSGANKLSEWLTVWPVIVYGELAVCANGSA